MTFLVSFARSDVALLASDMRTRWRGLDDDAPVECWDDGTVKVVPFTAGFLAGGPFVRFKDALAAQLQEATSPSEVRALVHAGAPVLLDAVEPEARPLLQVRHMTHVIGATAGRVWRLVLRWDGADVFPGTPDPVVCALGPTGTTPAQLLPFINTYQAYVARRQDVAEILHATVALYGRVYRLCGPAGAVSPRLTVGLVRPSGARELIESTIEERVGIC